MVPPKPEPVVSAVAMAPRFRLMVLANREISPPLPVLEVWVLSLALLSKPRLLAVALTVPPAPVPEVWAVICAASMLRARPCNVISPPLPLPLVPAVIDPWPKIDRVLAEVPSLIVPPWPPPGALCSVAALISELPEKAIARSRPVLELRLMAPAFPVLVALVLSWEPS